MPYSRRETLINSAASPVNSEWRVLMDFDRASLVVNITTGGTVQVWGSNKETPADDVQLGANITTVGASIFDFEAQAMTRWFRVKHTAGATAVLVNFNGYASAHG